MVVDPESSQPFVMLVMIFALYFTPSIIATARKHQNRIGVILLNLLLGWTIIGWIVALIWSVSANTRSGARSDEVFILNSSSPDDPYQSLEKLASLKDRGHITQDEYEREKSKLLRE